MNSQNVIGIVGLGYVGLPIALAFSKKNSTIAFDINSKRIKELKNQSDSNKEFTKNDFKKSKYITFTTDENLLEKANIFIVTVPTPVFKNNTVDKRNIIAATNIIKRYLKKESIIIYESTVYPGFCEEICLPILNKSNLVYNKDFFIGYSPERINPGDKKNKFEKINKVVSGSNKYSTKIIANLYKSIIKADVFIAKSIKVAEAAKVIENTQRDVNIALINEFALIFNIMGIDTQEVLKAASTKWNFISFWPGLVGGHCIGVDPYYLTHKAQQAGYHAKVITSGRYVNDSMGFYIAKQTVKKILAQGKHIQDAKVLVMGATFKEDVSDIRNSKVIDIVNELKSFQVKVDLVDPHASSKEMEHEYGTPLASKMANDYDAVIVAVNHAAYLKHDESYFQSLLKDKNGVFIDVKGIFKDQMSELEYWSL